MNLTDDIARNDIDEEEELNATDLLRVLSDDSPTEKAAGNHPSYEDVHDADQAEEVSEEYLPDDESEEDFYEENDSSTAESGLDFHTNTPSDGSVPLAAVLKQEGRKYRSIWSWMGDGFSLEPFIRRNVGMLVLIALLCCVSIFCEYRRQEQIRTIWQLESKLNDYRNRALFKRAEITATGQKQSVERRVAEEGLLLEPSKTPPYIVYVNGSRTADKK